MKKEDLINILNTYPDGIDVLVGLPVAGTKEMEIFGLNINYYATDTSAIISPKEFMIVDENCCGYIQ